MPKKVVVIIGSSGSGKSTVLRCINRLIEPTKGEIFLEDVQINSPSTDINEIRSEIGMVFQSFELFMHLKVLDNVSLGLIKVRGYSKEKAEDIAKDVLAKVDMSDKIDVYPGLLSGGHKQRVAIESSIVIEPDVLLADEPTGNLDTTSGKEVVKLIEELNIAGLTLIVVTHDREMGERSNRLIELRDGKIINDQNQRKA